MEEVRELESQRSYSHILKYTGLFGGIQGLIVGVGIIRNKLVAMLLGPDGMGLMSLLMSATKLISDATSFGVSISAVKNLSKDVEEGNEEKIYHTIRLIRSLSVLVALLGMLVCILCSPALDANTFSWKSGHLWHYILLSPLVGLMAITGGETAILKATRRLKPLATISFYSVIAALLISVPIFYVWGVSGIVPSLVLVGLAQMLFTIAYSYRYYPLRLQINRHTVSEGYDMLRLGIAFVMAGIFSSGAEFLIRSYLSTVANVEQVGLYNAGFMMMMTYVGLVFTSMETDYFPRLSGVPHLGEELNLTVNRQIEVMLLLVSPMLVFYIVFIPVLLPLLYSDKFLGAVDMSRMMVVAMYFRALVLPVEYIPLSRGDSKSFLISEAQYSFVIVLLVCLGYRLYGLLGAGLAISVTGLLNLAFVFLYAHWKFGYRPSGNVVSYTLIQLPLGILALVISFVAKGILFWITGGLLLVVSGMVSLTILRRKSRLWETLCQKVKAKFHK